MVTNKKPQYELVNINDRVFIAKNAPTSISNKTIDSNQYINALYYADKSALFAMVNTPTLSNGAVFNKINQSLSGRGIVPTISSQNNLKK